MLQLPFVQRLLGQGALSAKHPVHTDTALVFWALMTKVCSRDSHPLGDAA